jgi:hypothetical protein
MRDAIAVESDHKPLARAGIVAWQKVAAQAKYIGVFDVVDLRVE